MPTTDAFSSDIFSLTSLTAAINTIPFQPTGIQQLGIYESDGISTLDAFIEVEDGVLGIFDVKHRGALGSSIADEKRTGYAFRVPHIPALESIYADEIIGVRQFGTESDQQTQEWKRNKVLASLRRNMDYTLEYHRMTNILGSFIDANNTAVSLFTTFGLVEQTFDADLDDADQNVIGDCVTYTDAVADALGGVPFSGILALCGSTFWQAFRGHAEVQKYWINTPSAQQLITNPNDPIEFGGIRWTRYRGTSTVKIPDSEARLLPLGVPEMYITRYAPANYLETIGTVGLPFYSKSRLLDFDKGIVIEAQSNPLNLITRPRAIVKLTT